MGMGYQALGQITTHKLVFDKSTKTTHQEKEYSTNDARTADITYIVTD